MNHEADFLLENYNYHLPEGQIAQKPADRRDGSRLMVVERATGEASSRKFSDIIDLLPENALLVANNSTVIPARMFGMKPTGGKVEFLLLTPLPHLETSVEDGWSSARAQGLLKASKTPKSGQPITIADELVVFPVKQHAYGRWDVQIRWKGDLSKLLSNWGHLPLPPYICRPDNAADAERYQTTYADPSKKGSVAAPTAGLHFTPKMREQLKAQGFQWAEVTLYVGYGTFSPVREKDIRDHRMHNEFIEIPEATATAIRKAKAEDRPVIAIGTTSARTLEGGFAKTGEIAPFTGETDIFISPGYEFQVVDGMLTNFHLPESSLVIMVSALVGREKILAAYEKAVREGFRFFSYGDAMLIR